MGSLSFPEYREQIADRFGFDDYKFKKSKMNSAMFLRKAKQFIIKNWKLLTIIFGVLLISGVLKRILGRIGMIWALRDASISAEHPEIIDYNFTAISVHSAMYKGLFSWSEDEDALIGFVNALPSMESFLMLCRAYSSKYGKDLRTQLREHLTDKQYSKLLWK